MRWLIVVVRRSLGEVFDLTSKTINSEGEYYLDVPLHASIFYLVGSYSAALGTLVQFGLKLLLTGGHRGVLTLEHQEIEVLV